MLRLHMDTSQDARDLLKTVHDSLVASYLFIHKIAPSQRLGKDLDEIIEIEMGLEWTAKKVKLLMDQLQRESSEGS
jgi:hypothetical protein